MISIPDYIKINLYAKSETWGPDVTMVNINYDRKEIEFKCDSGLSGGISFYYFLQT